MPDKVAQSLPKQDAGLQTWKEDSFSWVRVITGNTAGLVTLCLVKTSVSASTERGIFAVFSFISLFSLCSIPVVFVSFHFLFMLQF